MYVSPSILMVYGLPWSGDNKHEDITATPAASIMVDNKNGIYFMVDFFSLRFIANGAHLLSAVSYRVMHLAYKKQFYDKHRLPAVFYMLLCGSIGHMPHSMRIALLCGLHK